MMSLSTKNADVDPSINVEQTASHVCSKSTLNGSSAISDFLAMCTVCNLQTVQVVLDLFRTLEGGGWGGIKICFSQNSVVLWTPTMPVSLIQITWTDEDRQGGREGG